VFGRASSLFLFHAVFGHRVLAHGVLAHGVTAMHPSSRVENEASRPNSAGTSHSLLGSVQFLLNWLDLRTSNFAAVDVCRYCSCQLVKIDYYGEVLIGCIECNRWGHLGGKKLIMQLLQHDLEA
jgi:hypothetical protein